MMRPPPATWPCWPTGALYRAKAGGRDRVEFTREMRARTA